MYIVSVKFSLKKFLCCVVALCIVIAVTCAVIPQRSSDVLSSKANTTAKTTRDHIDFLKTYGYNVGDKPIQIQEIIIPQEFSAEYEQYNNYQKLSGFDLSKFKGQRVKQYTYKVTDYKDSTDEVVANIYLYNDKVIGGDISSTTLGGFVHGFIKE